jgi:hypothetical protein
MGFGNYTLRSKTRWATDKTGWAKPTQAPPPICTYAILIKTQVEFKKVSKNPKKHYKLKNAKYATKSKIKLLFEYHETHF